MPFTNYFSTRGGQLLAGEVTVEEIAREHGTPLFIYDQGILRRKLEILRDALPEDFTVYYSIKANPNPAIVDFFLGAGCGLEIASRGELHVALSVGCPAGEILFAGPGKTDEELHASIEAGIGEIHVESHSEVERIARIAGELDRRVRCAIRVNPSAEAQGGAMRMGGKPAQFGVDEEELEGAIAAIRSHARVDFSGVHLFTGTQILDAAILAEQYRKCIEIAVRAAKVTGEPIHTVDFGGGLGVPYFANENEIDFEQMKSSLAEVAAMAREHAALEKTRFIVEPGRFLTAEAGVYVCSVNTVKVSRGKKYLILDGGMHHHLAASGNLGQVIKKNFPSGFAGKMDAETVEKADLVGPLCTPLDTIGRQVDVPAVSEGDIFVVFQSGSYARAASPLGFLSHPTPPEVLVDGKDVRLIRRRGTVEDMVRDTIV